MKRAIITSLLCLSARLLFAADAPQAAPLSAAVLNFQTADDGDHVGKDAAALLNAQLSSSPALILVERQELEKVLAEQQLGLSGDVTPATAAKVGSLTGAKVLITGRIFGSGQKLYLVAKVIGTETGRVFGDSVSFPDADHLDSAVDELAPKLESIIEHQATVLTAPVEDPAARMDRLKALIAGKKLPSVSVKITEQEISHIIIDPAAETEMKLTLQHLGFNVIEQNLTSKTADITIGGEAFSEYGGRTGNLVSSRARVEITATQNSTGKLLTTDRQTDTAIDTAESTASKSALENASNKLLDRLVPLLVAN